jgi:hypothetical protein
MADPVTPTEPVTPTFNITRAQIAAFVKDPRTVRDLEAFFRMVREVTPALTALAQTQADQGVADASEAETDAQTAITNAAAAQTDATQAISDAAAAQATADSKVEEAPVDGTAYVRKDAGWVAESAGGGSAWTLAASWTWSTNVAQVDITGLAGAKEIRIIAQDITLAASGVASVRVSVDNGTSFFAGASDYRAIANGSGIKVTTSGASLWSNVATAARSGTSQIQAAAANLRLMFQPGDTSNGQRLFVADTTNDINAIRVFPSAGGNITGGQIDVYTR